MHIYVRLCVLIGVGVELRPDALGYRSCTAVLTYFIFAVTISWGLWGEWQQCSKPCGGGKQMKVRPCLSNGQVVANSVCDSIVGSYMMERDCNIGPCCKIHLLVKLLLIIS